MRRILGGLCLMLVLFFVFTPTLVHAGGPNRPDPPKKENGLYIPTFLHALRLAIEAFLQDGGEPLPS